MSIISEERRRRRRIRWERFRYKWLKRNCPHICEWCRHRKICTIKYEIE